MLLPRATGPQARSRLMVAVEGQPQRVIGAVAAAVDPHASVPRWIIDLHVIPPFRRRGIGKALLDGVIEQAQQCGVRTLRAWDWMPPSGCEAEGWAWLGFSISQRREDFEVDLHRACAVLTPLMERVRRRIPPTARIVPLAEANLEAVAELHQQYLGGNRAVLRPLLTGSAPTGYDPHISSVLMLDGRVVGAVLGRQFEDGTCEADAKVLHPSVRRRWANIWLMHRAFEATLARGGRILRYFTLDAHQDTRQLSERFGGAITSCSVRMERMTALPTAAQPESGGEVASAG